MGFNDLSFSFSRHSTFNSCPRQYYLNYYASRNGWYKTASKEAQETYFAKKLTGIYAWAGTISHDIIEFALKEYRDHKKIYPLEELTKKALKRMKTDFLASQDRVKRNAAGDFYAYKLFGLMEHYYGFGVSKDKRRMIWDRVQKCLSNFFSSQIWQTIISSDTKQWKAIEDFSTFRMHVRDNYSVKVFSVPDFAFYADGKVYIYDWKTGKPKDAYRTQLSLYAVYASEFWGVKPEDVVCKIYYLLSNEVVDVDVSEETIAGIRKRVKESAIEMMEKLVDEDPIKNSPIGKENFPLTDNSDTCFFCQYKNLCGIKSQ